MGGRVRVEPYSGLNFAKKATTWTSDSPGETPRRGTCYRAPPSCKGIVVSEPERVSPFKPSLPVNHPDRMGSPKEH